MPFTISKDSAADKVDTRESSRDLTTADRGKLFLDDDGDVVYVIEDADCQTVAGRFVFNHLDLDACISWPIRLAPPHVTVTICNGAGDGA